MPIEFNWKINWRAKYLCVWLHEKENYQDNYYQKSMLSSWFVAQCACFLYIIISFLYIFSTPFNNYILCRGWTAHQQLQQRRWEKKAENEWSIRRAGSTKLICLHSDHVWTLFCQQLIQNSLCVFIWFSEIASISLSEFSDCLSCWRLRFFRFDIHFLWKISVYIMSGRVAFEKTL